MIADDKVKWAAFSSELSESDSDTSSDEEQVECLMDDAELEIIHNEVFDFNCELFT